MEGEWLPSHVQVTVLRARGLRAKGRDGTSDAFTIIQLRGERFRTAVRERSRSPEWGEQCSLAVPPAALLPASPPDTPLLLTVMHRALRGTDRFLGQARLHLGRLHREQGIGDGSRWYKLHSKPGEKEKERGEIEVSMQFVRNHLTASLLDLSTKEKPRSALGKIKDKMRGKKKRDSLTSDTASAILPASAAVPGASEEESIPSTKSKSRGFFFKSKIRKSSLTMSNSSLNSEQSARSLGSPRSPGSPSYTSPTSPKDTDPTRAMAIPSMQHSTASSTGEVTCVLRTLTHKRALSDELSRSDPALEPWGLAPKTSLLSRSSLCVNGSHVYTKEPLPALASSLFPNTSTFSRSLQNITKKPPEPTTKSVLPSPATPEFPHWTGTESRPVPPVITVDAGSLAEGLNGWSGKGARPVHAAVPMVSPSLDTGRRLKGNVSPAHPWLSPGVTKKSDSIKSEKTKISGWFHKDASKTLSLEVFPTVEISSDTPSPFPHSPLSSTPPSTSPGGRFNTNPFTASQGDVSPSPRPLANPFLSSLHTNPFYEDLVASHLIKSPPSARSFSSFSFGSQVRGEPLPSRSSIIREDLDPLPPGNAQTESWTEAQGSALVTQEVFFTEAGHGSASDGGVNAESWVNNAIPAGRREEQTIPEKLDTNLSQQEQQMFPEEQKMNLTQRKPEGIPQEVFPIEREVERSQSVPRKSHHDGNEDGAAQTESVSVNMALASPNLVSSSISHVALSTGVMGLPFASRGGLTGGESSFEGTCATMEESSGRDADWLMVKHEVGASEREMGAVEQDVGGAERNKGTPEREVGVVEQEMGAAEQEVGAGEEVCAQEQEVVLAELEAVEMMSTPPPPTSPRLLVVAPIGINASWEHAGIAASRSGDEGCGLSDECASPRLQVINLDEQSPGVEVDPSRGGLTESGCNEHYETCLPIPSRKGSDLKIQDWNPDHLHGSDHFLSRGLGSTAHGPQPVSAVCSPGLNYVDLREAAKVPSSSLECTSPASELPLVTGIKDQTDQMTTSNKETSVTSWARMTRRDSRGRGLARQEGDTLARPDRGQMPPVLAGEGKTENTLERVGEKDPSTDQFQPEPSSHCSQDPRAKGQEGACTAPEAKSATLDTIHNREIRQQRMNFQNVPEPSTTPCAKQSQEAPQGPWPLACSTPHPAALTNTRVTNLPSPILCPPVVAAPSAEPACLSSPLLSTGWKMSAVAVLPQETRPASRLSPQRTTSPHRVKPLGSGVPDSSAHRPLWPGIGSTLSSGLERLRTATTGSIAPVRPAIPPPQDPKGEKQSEPEDSAALYYHLTHDELIQKILDQDAELRSRRDQLRDLENYIDHLLVQIMETSPAILQVPTGKSKAAKR